MRPRSNITAARRDLEIIEIDGFLVNGRGRKLLDGDDVGGDGDAARICQSKDFGLTGCTTKLQKGGGAGEVHI